MKSRRKRNNFFLILIIFLVVVVLSYSIVGGEDAKGDNQYEVIYTSHNLSGHLVTNECPDTKCTCYDEDVGIAVNESYGEVTSNVQGRRNAYANAIGYKKFIETFPNGNPIASGIYKYTGQVRLPVLPFPDVNQTENPQAVEMMIQLWDGRNDLWDSNKNTLEGTIYWNLNPWTPDGKNGTIKIYNKSAKPEDLVDTGINRIDTDWHSFELVVNFVTKKYVSITFDNETKDLSNYNLVQVDHGPGSGGILWNDTNVSLSITTESLAAWPNLTNTFTWTTQFKDLEFSAQLINITKPKDGDTVYCDPVTVYGTGKELIKDLITSELSVWACVRSYDGIWYPQENLTMNGEETWEAVTRPGLITRPADIGEAFYIVVLVATEETDKELQEALIGKGNAADGWGCRPRPKGANILDRITVIRGVTEAKITEPKDGVTVYDNPVRVTGTVKNFPKQDCELSLWACVQSYDEIWYPQETLTMTGEETWEAYTNPGFSLPPDIGKEFGIVAMVATKEADEAFREALIGKGNAGGGWGWRPLPEGAKILDQITVIRGKR
jgi:hypothetical protein